MYTMAIYEAETTVNYRGFLIRVFVKCKRGRKGRNRNVKAEGIGYLTDVFLEDEYDEHELRTKDIDGATVEFVDKAFTDFRARSDNTTYLDNLDENWPNYGTSFFHWLYQSLAAPPKPTPLSTQVETALTEVQETIDQYIEDRSFSFDGDELKHGLANTLSRPVEDISVDRKVPTEEYADTTVSLDAILDDLDTESDPLTEPSA